MDLIIKIIFFYYDNLINIKTLNDFIIINLLYLAKIINLLYYS